MPLARIRRPLLALVALVAVLAIGYGARACDSDDGKPAHPPGHSGSPSGGSPSAGLSAAGLARLPRGGD